MFCGPVVYGIVSNQRHGQRNDVGPKQQPRHGQTPPSPSQSPLASSWSPPWPPWGTKRKREPVSTGDYLSSGSPRTASECHLEERSAAVIPQWIYQQRLSPDIESRESFLISSLQLLVAITITMTHGLPLTPVQLSGGTLNSEVCWIPWATSGRMPIFT